MAGRHERSGRYRVFGGLGAAGVAGYFLLHWLGRPSGSTCAERSLRLPGDELIERPTLVTNHAAHLPASPERVAVVDPARMAPRWLVHAPVGGPAAVSRELAECRSTGSVAGS